MMVATRPGPNIQILFQTHKILSNLPPYMFIEDDNPDSDLINQFPSPSNQFNQLSFPQEEHKNQDSNNKVDDNDDTAEPNFDNLQNDAISGGSL